MEAYYDEKLKRWIFPDTDLDEVAKPLGPPPTATPQASAPEPAPAATSNNPLAAMMAPPQRAPSALRSRGTPARFPGAATPGASLGGAPPVTPNFAVFTPKATDKKSDEGKKDQAPAQEE